MVKITTLNMSNTDWWRYENLEPCKPGQGWHEASSQGDHPDDNIDFHVDLGGGHIPKARLNIDRSENADIVMDLDSLICYRINDEIINNPVTSAGTRGRLPFPDNSIESIISHHCLEHIGYGFVSLIDESYRVLKKGGIFRIIVPMFPSQAAYESSDHKRLFGPDTFKDFEGDEDGVHWHESFAEPYTKARFKQTAIDYTPAPKLKATINGGNQVGFTIDDEYIGPKIDCDLLISKAREMRVTLTK